MAKSNRGRQLIFYFSTFFLSDKLELKGDTLILPHKYGPYYDVFPFCNVSLCVDLTFKRGENKSYDTISMVRSSPKEHITKKIVKGVNCQEC